jgi:hypothetical protein
MSTIACPICDHAFLYIHKARCLDAITRINHSSDSFPNTLPVLHPGEDELKKKSGLFKEKKGAKHVLIKQFGWLANIAFRNFPIRTPPEVASCQFATRSVCCSVLADAWGPHNQHAIRFVCCACAAPPASPPSQQPPSASHRRPVSFPNPVSRFHCLVPASHPAISTPSPSLLRSCPSPLLRRPTRLLVYQPPAFLRNLQLCFPRLGWLGFGECVVRRHDDAGSQARRDLRPRRTRCTLSSISQPSESRFSTAMCTVCLGQLV